MWAFEVFPAKLEKQEGDGIYSVEVFGLIDIESTLPFLLSSIKMFVFRQTDVSLTFDITLLPINEFEARFKDYKLVQEIIEEDI